MNNLLLLIYTDTDECAPDPDPCGFGTCTNADIPTFYTCDCGDGGELNGGDASIGTLGCDGKLT